MMYIPEFKYTFYGPIVLGSILIGIIVASCLMAKAGTRKETVGFTAILTFVTIIMTSFAMSIVLHDGDIRKIGFVGAGGALGLILGATISALIHRDHVPESVAAWIISAPLMYGLSKIACHIAGCCNGIPYDGFMAVTYEARGASFFPVQLLETVVFLIIALTGFVLYIKSDDKLKMAEIILMLSGFSKAGIEFLRESHMGQTVSNYQILVIMITLIGTFTIKFLSRIGGTGKAEQNDF